MIILTLTDNTQAGLNEMHADPVRDAAWLDNTKTN